MKPEESAGCHQTLSARWGLGTRLVTSGRREEGGGRRTSHKFAGMRSIVSPAEWEHS